MTDCTRNLNIMPSLVPHFSLFATLRIYMIYISGLLFPPVSPSQLVSSHGIMQQWKTRPLCRVPFRSDKATVSPWAKKKKMKKRGRTSSRPFCSLAAPRGSTCLSPPRPATPPCRPLQTPGRARAYCNMAHPRPGCRWSTSATSRPAAGRERRVRRWSPRTRSPGCR